MKKFTEREFLTNEFFSGYQEVPVLSTFTMALGVGFVFSTAIGIPLDILLMGNAGLGLLLAGLPGAIIGAALPNLGRLYAGNGIRHSFIYEARYYFKLPKDDRAMYPTGIIDALKDNDLNGDESWKLQSAMQDLRLEIDARNEARRLITKRAVDVEDITARLREAKDHVAVETETYQELR